MVNIVLIYNNKKINWKMVFDKGKKKSVFYEGK